MNNKLYVGNLPFTAQEADILSMLSSAGVQCSNVRILTDRETGRSRGFGFAEFASSEDAEKAVQQLNGQDFMGRKLVLSEARQEERRDGGNRGGFGGGRGGFGGGRGGFGGNREERGNRW